MLSFLRRNNWTNGKWGDLKSWLLDIEWIELETHEMELNGLTTDLQATYLHLLGTYTSDLRELMDVKLREEDGTLYEGLICLTACETLTTLELQIELTFLLQTLNEWEREISGTHEYLDETEGLIGIEFFLTLSRGGNSCSFNWLVSLRNIFDGGFVKLSHWIELIGLYVLILSYCLSCSNANSPNKIGTYPDLHHSSTHLYQ